MQRYCLLAKVKVGKGMLNFTVIPSACHFSGMRESSEAL